MCIISSSSSSSSSITTPLLSLRSSLPPSSIPKPHNIPYVPIGRRHLLTAVTISISISISDTPSTPPQLNSLLPVFVPVADARGLFQMPPFRLSNSYIVPEYSFLDARGLGAYEGKNLDSVSEVYASDSISTRIKPPPIDDGTPNESVADVFVRVTQLMSILETQYSGDTVIIVSPDSDNLTILQAGLVGLDLRRHRDLSFAPGEVRFVDASSIPTYKQPASALYKYHLLVFYWSFTITSGDSQSGVPSNLGERSALNIATQVAIHAGLRCPNLGA